MLILCCFLKPRNYPLEKWKLVLGSSSVRICFAHNRNHHPFTFNPFFRSSLYSDYNFASICGNSTLLSNLTRLLPLLLPQIFSSSFTQRITDFKFIKKISCTLDTNFCCFHDIVLYDLKLLLSAIALSCLLQGELVAPPSRSKTLLNELDTSIIVRTNVRVAYVY